MAIERKFIEEGEKRMLIKEYLKSETERAGFGGLEIQRTPMGTLISLITERPGLIIGRGGKKIKELTDRISDVFDIENPQIEIEEVGDKAALNAHIMAQKVAVALERGWHFRRVGHSTVRRIMDAGARGCQIIIAGKITGARHRTEKFTRGHVKYCGEVANEVMDEGMAVAKKKPGILGVKVRLMKADAQMPDEIFVSKEEVKEVKEEVKEIKEEVEEVKEEVKEIKEEVEEVKEVKKKEEKKPKLEEKLEKMDIAEIPSIGASIVAKLKKADIVTAKDLHEIAVDDLLEIKGVGIKTAEKLKEALEKAVK